MLSLAELITQLLEAQRVELTLTRDVAGAGTYLQAQQAYGQWLLACAETDAARGRVRARVQVQAHMPPTVTDLPRDNEKLPA